MKAVLTSTRTSYLCAICGVIFYQRQLRQFNAFINYKWNIGIPVEEFSDYKDEIIFNEKFVTTGISCLPLCAILVKRIN